MVHGENRIPYWIDRRLTGLAGPEYHAIISFRLAFEPEDSQYGKSRDKTMSGSSEAVIVIDNPIYSANGQVGAGMATIKWRDPSAAPLSLPVPAAAGGTYTVRHRKLFGDHTFRSWRPRQYGPASSVDVTDLEHAIGGLDPGGIYGIQLHYDTSAGTVFSARDAYVWASSGFPEGGSRVGTYQFFGHWEQARYGYTICSATFIPNNGDWPKLIAHAFEQWEEAIPHQVRVTRKYEGCMTGEGAIDNDNPMSVITALYNESNEVYMVDTREWPPHYPILVLIHNRLFHCITGAPGFSGAGACVISPRYTDGSKEPSKALEEGSVDVLVNVRRSPTLDGKLTLDMPGNDQVFNREDVYFNTCKGGTAFRNYELMVHEAGHALGLSNFYYPSPWSYDVSHPTIPDAVMNNDKETGVREPDCSPHPFDVMAIEALYQSVEQP